MTHAREVFARQTLLTSCSFLGKSGIFLNFRLRAVDGSYICVVNCIPVKRCLEIGKSSSSLPGIKHVNEKMLEANLTNRGKNQEPFTSQSAHAFHDFGSISNLHSSLSKPHLFFFSRTIAVIRIASAGGFLYKVERTISTTNTNINSREPIGSRCTADDLSDSRRRLTDTRCSRRSRRQPGAPHSDVTQNDVRFLNACI